MEILVLPFLVLILWVIFFVVFIAKKASEDKPKTSVIWFWVKLSLFALSFGLVGSFLFKFLRTGNFLPSFIESTVLANSGGFIGFLFGAVYVLVTYEPEKN